MDCAGALKLTMTVDFLSCAGLGSSPAQVFAAWLHAYSESPDWFRFRDRDIVFTHQGRSAIAFVCQLLEIEAGDEVLVPAYNCGVEVDPYAWSGAKLVFYRVDAKAAIDLDDVFRRVTPSTRLIHVTHYFGWPQDIGELAKWCKQRGVFLLEDCALALFSQGPGGTIGQTGDAAIYSFRKSLPVPDGGALTVTKGLLREGKVPSSSQRPSMFHGTLPLLKRWFMHDNTSWQRSSVTRNLLTKSWLAKPMADSSEPYPDIPQGYYFDGERVDWGMSRTSKGILCATKADSVIQARRRNYLKLRDALHDVPVCHPLHEDLPDGVCPLSFPLLVEDRDRWYRELEASGILVRKWWVGYHRALNRRDFPETCTLKSQILTLPVHQALDVHHMRHIAECVRVIGQ